MIRECVYNNIRDDVQLLHYDMRFIKDGKECKYYVQFPFTNKIDTFKIDECRLRAQMMLGEVSRGCQLIQPIPLLDQPNWVRTDLMPIYEAEHD